jgi:hypothetical protein
MLNTDTIICNKLFICFVKIEKAYSMRKRFFDGKFIFLTFLHIRLNGKWKVNVCEYRIRSFDAEFEWLQFFCKLRRL